MLYRFTGLILLFLAWLFIRTSCNRSSGEPLLLITSAVAEDHYPGIFSNLKSVRTYTITVSASIADTIHLVALETDSVSIPIESWAVERLRKQGLSVVGIHGEFSIRASRNFYQEAHKSMVEEQTYEPSGYQLSNSVRLVYRYRDKTLRSNEIEITASKPVYHE